MFKCHVRVMTTHTLLVTAEEKTRQELWHKQLGVISLSYNRDILELGSGLRLLQYILLFSQAGPRTEESDKYSLLEES